jgi:hypothetical protein
MDLQKLTLEIEQHIEINAEVGKVFEGLLSQLTDRSPVPLHLERWPGGRWFRDLGEGAGHLWGFVQVYKPPTLLEVQGPLFMSYPVAGHVQFRLSATADGTRITLRHRAFGLIDEEHRKGANMGWQKILNRVKEDCESS